MMQQTPNALAQFPSAVPEEEHSVEVMQTPLRPEVDTAEHSSFLNVTMLNKENCFVSLSLEISYAEENAERQMNISIFSSILLLDKLHEV
jgi:hypothetical protein